MLNKFKITINIIKILIQAIKGNTFNKPRPLGRRRAKKNEWALALK